MTAATVHPDYADMHDAHEFLQTLAIVMSVAAVTTVVFHRLRQPVVFGYLFAGMIVGPHIPIPLVADEEIVRVLAEMGVILLLFALGLEFSLRKLIRVGPTAGVIAVAQSTTMVVIGFALGQLFGWTPMESIYAGAVIAISSTTIIAKAFEEQRVTGPFTELVLGILIIEDLIAILLLAVLTAVSAGGGVSPGELAATAMRLVVFLAVLIGVGLLLIPRTVRAVVKMNRPETTLVASMGICFAAALAALSFGYSVALGAFIAGSLVAESGEETVVEHLVQPVRDMFAAIFFVSVGVLIDPTLVAEHWLPVVVFTIIVIVGKVFAVTVSSFLIGFSPRTSVQAGMSLAQIGEFSFIIATVGLATGATGDFLYPVAVAVSAITTLTTPWLIRFSGPAASYVDRKLPRPLQTFVTLYGSWIERVRSVRATATGPRPQLRRMASLVLLDAALIAAVIIGGALEIERFSEILGARTGIAPEIARVVIVALAAVVAVPLLVGLVTTARRLGLALAVLALPQSEEGLDLGAAPRRALVVTFQLVIVSVMAIGVLVLTQPFLPTLRSGLVTGVIVAVVGALLLGLTIAFWRSATNLHGHARAGAEIIVSALAQQMSTPGAGSRRPRPGHTMERAREMLPGLGEPVPLRIPRGSPVAGRTLAEIDLRAITGATVLAILRDQQHLLMPSGSQTVSEGDVLAVVGTHDAVEGARSLLAAEPLTPAPEGD
ncbi:MAG TPA: cation:proton antiporter [Gemmatimonadaceae bacterium]|nr:cation:proton antiporter [Gemmatimonadaceae bacterium]